MGLREQARDDLDFTVGDRETGFGWDITVTRPDGDTLDLVALQSDIAETIDPETGIAILGRSAHVAIKIQDFLDQAPPWEIPVVITDPEKRPWKVDTWSAHFDVRVRPSRPTISQPARRA